MSKNMLDDMNQNQIYALKALAIFGVVTAHGTAVPDYFSDACIILSAMIRSIGSMGVGIFFCVSGYLLAQGGSRYLTFATFWKKKCITIIIPWMISSILVYLYVALRKGGTVLGWLTSFLGYLSSYWYLSVLMIFYLVFWFVLKAKNDRVFCIIACVLSPVSVVLRNVHIIPPNAFGVYLNVFNWCIFFAMGILLADAEKMQAALYRIRYVLYAVVIMTVLLLGFSKISISYFAWFYLPAEIVVIFAAICLSKQIADNSCLQKIGKASFAIYLYHELPWAGLIASICNRFDQWSLVLIRPFMILGTTCFMLWGGMKVAKLMHLESLYCRLTGYRG